MALVSEFKGQILPTINLEDTDGNIEKHNPELPIWIKSAAKLLNTGDENQDWMALSKLMGINVPLLTFDPLSTPLVQFKTMDGRFHCIFSGLEGLKYFYIINVQINSS